MNAFYNKEGIGDVLMLPMKTGDRYQRSFRTYGDVVEIYDTTSEAILGYNIFNASLYFKIEENPIVLDEAWLQAINACFNTNQVPNPLTLDLTPKFVVGYVKSKTKHPDADKLNVCQVDLGTDDVQIVCGAANVDEGQHVVVAKVGALMPDGMEIKAAKLRGVDSTGMICSQKELGLPNAPEEKGIYVLTGDVSAGDVFTF